MTFTLAINLEWWQLVIAGFYLFVGLLFCGFGILMNGYSNGWGNAFGYPEERWTFWNNLFSLFLWPLIIVLAIVVLTYGYLENKFGRPTEMYRRMLRWLYTKMGL